MANLLTELNTSATIGAGIPGPFFVTIQDIAFSAERWAEFWKFFRAEPQQLKAIEILRQHILESDPALLTEAAVWAQTFRERPPAPADYPNTWDGVKAAAQACGAKFPELVAAQWMLESAGGTAFSGKNNPFGLKGSGTACGTTEVYNGETVHITASFIDFPSLKAAINYLVTRWYLDYRGYRGVNHAASANDAAWELKHQGYATDPSYPEKLCRIMKEHA
jgi:hypothetical protein